MLVLLAGIFVFHIATVIMIFVSTIANVWMVSENGTYSEGLWSACRNEKCDVTLAYGGDDALKSVQAFMILAIIFSVISLIIFIFQLFTMEKGNRFFLSGAIMLVCWLCILIGVSIYTDKYGNVGRNATHINTYKLDHHGYSFILAWICFCFSFIIGVLYLVLRKK
ncbi:epithelial membrane protein 1 [Gracilinanus agilis]|uniref:epithelial membrane protein 1 n=1 Tax=Gracilinanus agilis TaxID=191870 RepID=UPI001CFC9668|nr:epithelial membrane protein 1 [Gracilinanus agilis]